MLCANLGSSVLNGCAYVIDAYLSFTAVHNTIGVLNSLVLTAISNI